MLSNMSDNRSVPSLARSVVTGTIGFCLVSLVVFATVAFGEPWLYERFRVTGSYVVWTGLFILLGGAVLGSLVVGRCRLPMFYLLFVLAFIVYLDGCVVFFSMLSWITGKIVRILAVLYIVTILYDKVF